MNRSRTLRTTVPAGAIAPKVPAVAPRTPLTQRTQPVTGTVAGSIKWPEAMGD